MRQSVPAILVLLLAACGDDTGKVSPDAAPDAGADVVADVAPADAGGSDTGSGDSAPADVAEAVDARSDAGSDAGALSSWLFPFTGEESSTATGAGIVAMYGWNVPSSCTGLEPANTGTLMPATATCTNVGNRHYYVASAEYFEQGAGSAHGDAARACAGFPAFCAAVADRGTVFIQTGLMELQGAASDLPTIWDTRTYAPAVATGSVKLVRNNAVIATGDVLSATEVIEPPATGCASRVHSTTRVRWTTFANNQVGKAFEQDVTLAGSPVFKIQMDNQTPQQIVTAGITSCRTGLGLFRLGLGSMTVE